MGRLAWVWASPPDDDQRELAVALEAGSPPQGSELLKRSRARQVWRVPGASGGLLLKRYTIRTRDALRARLLPGLAEREYRAMESLCRRGVPTTRPVAWADRRDGGLLRESWFLARFVPGATTLIEALGTADGSSASRLADEALALAAELHAHPVYHRDLHAGNLLVDGSRLLVIDLHSMWFVPRLTRRMRLANLARLLYSLRGHVSLDDLGPLVRTYADRRGELLAPLLADVRRAVDRFERDYVRGRSARALRDSTEFTRERIEAGRVHKRRSYPTELLSADLAEHMHVVSAGGPGLLGHSPTSRTSRVSPGPAARIVKQDVRTGAWSMLRARLGFGRTRNAWTAARRCDVVGVPTPEALALLERADGSAVLVMRDLGDASSLRDLLREAPPQGRERARLAFAVGHVVGRLSRAGLRHADLSAKNLLARPVPAAATRDRRTTPGAGAPDVQLIDLDGMRVVGAHDERALARMLGQLGDLPPGVTRTDLRRFALGFRRGAGRDIPPGVAVAAARRTHARQRRRAALALDRSAGER